MKVRIMPDESGQLIMQGNCGCISKFVKPRHWEYLPGMAYPGGRCESMLCYYCSHYKHNSLVSNLHSLDVYENRM